MQVGIGRNRDSGLIAGYRRLLDVRSAKTFTDDEAEYMTQSATHHWRNRAITGRANYEVTKTVTDDHAVWIAQSATHQRMSVTACSMDQYAEQKRTEKNLIVRSISEAETTNNKRLRSTFCIEDIQTRSICHVIGVCAYCLEETRRIK